MLETGVDALPSTAIILKNSGTGFGVQSATIWHPENIIFVNGFVLVRSMQYF